VSSLKIGERFGGYEILSFLGKGGMGEVYKARDCEGECDVALKVLSAAFSADADRLSRFKKEAHLLAKLSHPNILTIIDVGTYEETYYIVSEFLEGETLRQRINRGRLSQRAAVECALGITRGLVAAHEQHIIHRDLKPENIFITRDGQVKILDFSLAKLKNPTVPDRVIAEAQTVSVATEPGLIMGTVGYMSPEQAQGRNDILDKHSDIFSFGAILNEMLAGQRAFSGESYIEVLHEIIKEDPPPISTLVESLDPALELLIQHCLEKRPENRPASAHTLVDELTTLSTSVSLSNDAGTESKSSGSQPRLARSSSRTRSNVVTTNVPAFWGRSRLTILALAALTLVIAVVYYSYRQGYFSSAGAGPQVVARAPIDSIAVLPFVDVTGKPGMEYLTDGMTESIINNLSSLRQVTIIARSTVFRYKGQEVDPQTVGREVSVRAVLIGRVQQRNDDLDVSVELVDAKNGQLLWSGTYSRPLSDLIILESKICEDVALRLSLKLSGEESEQIAKHFTENAQAYHLYLRGRYYWNQRTGDDIKKGIDLFEQAITADPNYALAYAGLADSYNVLWVYTSISPQLAHQKAKQAALKALELDELLAEAHTALSSVKFDDEWDFAGAERELKRAIELRPNYAVAYMRLADHLSPLGRHDEALQMIARAQRLDPLSPIINTVAGYTLLKARKYDEAIAQLQKVIDLDKGFFLARMDLRDAYLAKGMYEESIAEEQIASIMAGDSPEESVRKAGLLRRAFKADGPEGYWQKRLELSEQELALQRGLHRALSNTSPYLIATICARLQKTEQAIRWLERADDEHDPYLLYLNVDPEFDYLKFDQRVVGLLQRIGLR
jgi:serine/threonine protein kinase/tetratricopeptide (TPR) repeat protein